MSVTQSMKTAANNGDVYAMTDLGVSYRFAYNGAKQDLEEAMKWFGMAVDMLHPEAYCCMGYASEIPIGYLDPNDDKTDYKRAFGYFIKGALIDEPNSVYKVTDMLYSGKYVESNCDFALLLYQKSLEMIDDEADSYVYPGLCLRIGECYYKGIGNGINLNKACEYFTTAIDEYEGRMSSGEQPEFIMSSLNRAKFLLKRAKVGELIEQALQNDETYKSTDDLEKQFFSCIKRVLPDKKKNFEALKYLIKMYRQGLRVDKDEKYAELLEKLNSEVDVFDE